MAKSLIQLPEIIFTLIQTFLSYDDYHYFLNTSKLHFSHLKRRTIVLRLTERRSLQYMEDKEFQGLLLSKVEDGWKQIRVKITREKLVEVYDSSAPHMGIEFDPILPQLSYRDLLLIEAIPPLLRRIRELSLDRAVHLKDIKNLSHLEKLSIEYQGLKDISTLKDIPDLTLKYCTELSNFSSFHHNNRVQRLYLDNCPKLVDVSCLTRIRILLLTNCYNLENVSPLHGIHDLSIICCEKVRDISGLGDHHRLDIEYCSYNLSGYECLVSVRDVILARCDISDLSVLRYAKSIDLRRCDKISDVSPIKNVRKVFISGSTNITNLKELREVYDLALAGLDRRNQEDLFTFQNHKFGLYSLSNDMGKGINILSSFLSKTKHLSLSNSFFQFSKNNLVEYATIFRHLESLTIENASLLTEVKGLEDIPTVRLINLPFLSDISGLGRNHCIELRFCPRVIDVSSLINMKIVVIEACESILNYDLLLKVPRLKIIENNLKDEL